MHLQPSEPIASESACNIIGIMKLLNEFFQLLENELLEMCQLISQKPVVGEISSFA